MGAKLWYDGVGDGVKDGWLAGSKMGWGDEGWVMRWMALIIQGRNGTQCDGCGGSSVRPSKGRKPSSGVQQGSP